MSEINGLPIRFFVIAGGIILVLSSWVLMRFGKVIARAVLTVAALVIGRFLCGLRNFVIDLLVRVKSKDNRTEETWFPQKIIAPRGTCFVKR